MSEIYGLIYRGNKLYPLSSAEYKHWLNHPLPFGWVIAAKPIIIEEE